ncbi:MAG: neutral zinc metallopeptidase [Polyangiaceae bacterium]|nr:neutral zinc metallopeptidase [Polyangiaceae bacterium]
MRWDQNHRSQNVEDRRGGPGGGRGGMKIGLGGAVLLLVLSLIFKKNMFAALGVTGGGVQGDSPTQPVGNDELGRFAAFVFDDAQAFWQKELSSGNARYRTAKLVLFSEETNSACGPANSAIGPFYCPGDEKVYIDLGFYYELKTKFGAPGDFAQAYVMAHEVGHHIQTVLGIEDRVRADQRRNPGNKNALSIKMELQADCFAGMWAHSTARRDLLEKGDIEEGLAAAASVGDDRIQSAATGRIQPEKWTHGSAKERSTWFRKGYTTGNLAECDTFASP